MWSPRTRHLFTQGLKSIRQVFTVFLTNFPPSPSLFLLDMMKISPGIRHHSFFWTAGIRHVEQIPLHRSRHQLDIYLVVTLVGGTGFSLTAALVFIDIQESRDIFFNYFVCDVSLKYKLVHGMQISHSSAWRKRRAIALAGHSHFQTKGKCKN
jgi:hypothetical protein